MGNNNRKIIDFHTHTFPVKIADRAVEKLSHDAGVLPFSDGTEEGLAASMRRSGISLSVVLPVATAAKQVIHINDASAQLNENWAEASPCLFSIGCIHPDFADYRAELARVKELGLKGIKIHPVYQGVPLNDKRFLNIIDRAAELGLFVLTHAGYDIGYPALDYCNPAMAREVIDTVGDFPFILAHMGGWGMWDTVPEYLADTSCFLDTAFSIGILHERADDPLDAFWKDKKRGIDAETLEMLDQARFMNIYTAFGSKRILFATDSPWSSPEEGIAFIEGLDISEKEKEDIFSGNAMRVLGEQECSWSGRDGAL